MEPAKKRSSNFTTTEENILVSLVRKHKEIIENKRTDTVSNKNKAAAWSDLAKEYNALCGDVSRDAKTLKNKYENLKKRTKEKFASEKSHRCKTGGGPPAEFAITNVECEIKDMIGVQLTGLHSLFDDDADVNDQGIIGDDIVVQEVDASEIISEKIPEAVEPSTSWTRYTPQQLRQKISTPLRRNKRSNASTCERDQLSNKISKWAEAKEQLGEVQIQCRLEEHRLKLKLMQELHDKQIAIIEKESDIRIKLTKDEHKKKWVNYLKFVYKNTIQNKT